MDKILFQYKHNNTNRAFEDAVRRLNSHNSNDLFAISCIMSCIDVFTSIDKNTEINILFPVLNFKKISMFNKALIISSATMHKSRDFSRDTLTYVMNKLLDAETTQELNDESVEPLTRILNIYTKMGNDQFRLQQNDFLRSIGRTIALFEHIPEKYQSKIKEKHKRNYVDIPQVFESKYGISLKKYLQIGLILYMWHNSILNKYFHLTNEKREALNINRKNNNFLTSRLWEIIDSSKEFRNKFFFTLETFRNIEKYITEESHPLKQHDVSVFINLLSKTKKELQYKQNHDPFNRGEFTYRVCVLERYPIIKQDNIGLTKYIVPSLSYFQNAVSSAPHFMMQELYPDNQYNETFGSVFECYIREIIKERGNDLCIIPEIRYKKNRNHVDGPDFTLLDNKNNYMIVLELKSKSMRLNSRLMPLSDDLIKDLSRAFLAFEKMPAKIEDLFYGYPEYKRWQYQINKIPKENVFCLVVINKGIFFLPEIINEITKNDSEHILNKLVYKYALMDLDRFENCLELAHGKHEPIIKLLNNYYKDSINSDLKVHSADSFRGRTVESNDFYLLKHINKIINDFKHVRP